MPKGRMVELMFDYDAGAELYSGHAGGFRNHKTLGYLRFPRAAEAIQFAIEVLSPDMQLRVLLEVDEDRFDASEIRRLYDDGLYPLQRRPVAADETS